MVSNGQRDNESFPIFVSHKNFLMRRIALLLLSVQSMVSVSPAQNPIVPAGIYFADPAARFWDDGRIYVYGSVDENCGYYCSKRYHVLSSPDLQAWKLHPNTFASAGEGDEVPYSDNLLFAPDCHCRDGRYYLYYCLASRENTEGVAVSDSPAGPFKKGEVMDMAGYNEIDPAVFIDEDGQGYYLWGQFTVKMARLKPGMKEIDPSTILDSVITERDHFFHEGATMVKRNSIYYLVYSHMGRADMPTCIGYSTATSPMGPYTYGGVIIDNDHCDPGNWNNHGSLLEFNGQWYVFYHRSTHGCRTMRKACVEPIFFNPDGSISEVEMTSQGAAGPFSAFDTIQAERACMLFGNVRIQAFSDREEELGKIQAGDRAVFKYVDFWEGADSVSICLKMVNPGGMIHLVADRPWNRPFATIGVPAEIPAKDRIILKAGTGSLAGVHALWLRFSGEGEEDMFTIDWLLFESIKF